jgi:UDP-glucose 4-epimerase
MVRELVNRGIEVISSDIIPARTTLKGVEYHTGTIMDPFTISRLLKGCDAVFHLAAILGVKRADVDLLRCMTINIQGTINVLEACVMSGVSNIVLTSSSEIFGDITTGKIREDSPLNPKSGYAVSKLAAEQFAEAFRKEYGINHRIVRFFNIYGPGQVAEFVLPRFVKMVQEGIAPRIYGDGKQVRSFCHIRDASRAVVDLFLRDATLNQSFNIGNDREPVTMHELAEKIIALLGAKMQPEFVPFHQSDRHSSREIYYRVPDISKIRTAIQYEPRVSLDEGILDVLRSGDIPDSWIEPITGRRA